MSGSVGNSQSDAPAAKVASGMEPDPHNFKFGYWVNLPPGMTQETAECTDAGCAPRKDSNV